MTCSSFVVALEPSCGAAAAASLLDNPPAPSLGAVARVDGRGLSRAAFRREFEDASRPCLLLHLADAWPALADDAWAPERLAERLGSCALDLGRESHEHVQLEDFLQLDCGGDNSDGFAPAPRYIFDGTVLGALPSLLADFAVPQCFPRDDHFLGALFASVPALRPAWRWLLVGGPGSGFAAHVDPHETCAWNAVVRGRKRWALLPPDVAESAVFHSQLRPQRCSAAADSEVEEEAGAEAGPQLACEASAARGAPSATPSPCARPSPACVWTRTCAAAAADGRVQGLTAGRLAGIVSFRARRRE